MADPLARGTLFPPELITDLVSKVNGHSTLAKLSQERPLGFNGAQEMVFDMPSEMEIVGEGLPKTHGGITVTPTTIIPIKFVYGARVSDEFIFGAEEARVDYLREFSEGFGKKAARALDISAISGLNPRSGQISTVVNGNDFVTKVTTSITTGTDAAEKLTTAITAVQGMGHEVTGVAMAHAFASDMGEIKANGVPLYPEFQFGQAPETFRGLDIDVNNTVNTGSTTMAIVGNFRDYFRWGFAKDIPIEVIKYGDPDNTGSDLRGHNQVYIRAEIYMGWGILDPTAFAIVAEA